MRLLGLSALLLTGLLPGVLSYIPASPTNSTDDAIAGGLNVTDVSKLHLQWYMNGSYWENISYQLVGNGSQGISKGALLHFSEEKNNNNTPGTTTPWIALVSCDKNATDADQELDIFTLARDKGAVAALLYSLSSVACIINPEYADPETFDQVFDIFSTQSLTSSHLIEYQFGQIGTGNDSIGGTYDSQRLNDSAAIMNETIQNSYAPEPGFLFATLWAYNATGASNDSTTTGSGGGTGDNGQKGSSNTALAMIVLYAITGCVSALFCVIIITGAIRAIRHPERYGPRRHGGGEVYQSRTQGLTRAILDTFPIVKFGSSMQPRQMEDHAKDPENGAVDEFGRNIGMKEIPREPSLDVGETIWQEAVAPPRPRPAKPNTLELERGGSGDDNNGEGASRGDTPPSDDVPVPAAIGRETCPICIVDFEDDDDVRILPCEGKHRFHQQCVDPWLLELSSSCPICRQDFLALESMLSREGSVQDENHQEPERHLHEPPRPHSLSSNRFSRYIRSAMRRRRDREEEVDPTDPPLPTVAHTAI
ncbi:hypothetical protein CPB85DRAFT_1242210 [Mucidula mucida]|nr:hypothetical protein CPB85DRAFT_1242210 [Mucidula mucida]